METSERFDGPPNVEELKARFDSNPTDFVAAPLKEPRATATKYVIVDEALRSRVKEGVKSVGDCESEEKPTDSTSYRMRVKIGDNAVTITQFNNGTLLLQGKENDAYETCCDIVFSYASAFLLFPFLKLSF